MFARVASEDREVGGDEGSAMLTAGEWVSELMRQKSNKERPSD